ncbi:hypothetical protein DFH07DRAFT_857874 [Mycena maculata]|uniref:BTB domain-containing protein n=1 Tax=Mycena maculata TaxID=230809 RepID=A0AAD7HI87_9AGAR|nr:hypothetical protein DFH07DRAFT_857874 [Mycena maculata]
MAIAAQPPPYMNPTSAEPLATRKHEEYYFPDGNLVIQVSGTLFKIWDGPIRRHSKAFPIAAVSLIDDKVAANDGSDNAHPLVLEGVESADFERLLWIVYPPVIGQCKATTTRDWTAILDLATRWEFADIRTLAIRELAAVEIDPVERIEMQQQFGLQGQWAHGAYIALCTRQDALNLIEARKLGIEMTVKVAFAREKLDKWGRKKPDEVKKVVEEVFGITA